MSEEMWKKTEIGARGRTPSADSATMARWTIFDEPVPVSGAGPLNNTLTYEDDNYIYTHWDILHVKVVQFEGLCESTALHLFSKFAQLEGSVNRHFDTPYFTRSDT